MAPPPSHPPPPTVGPIVLFLPRLLTCSLFLSFSLFSPPSRFVQKSLFWLMISRTQEVTSHFSYVLLCSPGVHSAPAPTPAPAPPPTLSTNPRASQWRRSNAPPSNASCIAELPKRLVGLSRIVHNPPQINPAPCRPPPDTKPPLHGFDAATAFEKL